MDSILSREKLINAQCDSLVQDYRNAHERLVELSRKQSERQEIVTGLTAELQRVTDEYERVKVRESSFVCLI